MILIYLRKSRADRADETVEEVLERHEAQLQEYAEREFGYRIPQERIFREVVSGETITDRPMMRLLLQQIESANVEAVLVIEPQRLTRGDLEDCGKIVNTFRYSGTKVITPLKSFDLADKWDRKIFESELIRGNDYLEYTKEILRRGLIHSAKQGYVLGRPPFGYRKAYLDPQHHTGPTLEIVPDEAIAVRLIFHLYLDKHFGLGKIVDVLQELEYKMPSGEPLNKHRIQCILSNPTYTGKVRYGYRQVTKVMENGQLKRKITKNDDCILVDGFHPAIIDQATFDRAQDIHGRNARVNKGKQIVNPLAGLVKCGRCGAALQVRRQAENPLLCCRNQSVCRCRSPRLADVKAKILQALRENLQDYKLQMDSDNSADIRQWEADIRAAQDNIKELEALQERQYSFLENGVYTPEAFVRRNKMVQDQISAAALQLEALQARQPEKRDYGNEITTLRQVIDMMEADDMPVEDQNAILKAAISRVVYNTPYNVTRFGGRKCVQPDDFSLEVYLRF